MTAALLDALRTLLGPAQVLTDGDLSAWERDWRKRWHGKALAVVRPGGTAEVAQVLQLCAQHGASVVPQGGNTGLVGGGVPDMSGTQVLLSLQRLNRVRGIDLANLTMTVEAGMVLQAVQQAASDAGLLFPLSLAAEGSCTIGGNLATNAGGTQVLRYGNARELCLGLEVVTAQGEVWSGLSGLRKDNTGYDLRDLFIGSEGTLGVIQARLGAGLTGFEVMNQFSLGLVRQHFPQLNQPLPPGAWTVLLEYADADGESTARTRFESLLEAALEAGTISDAVVAESLAQSATLWH
ncbi:MAG: hydroxyacid dehydrogenase, partial [Burkholderiales bacterium PBB5]